MYNYNQDFNYAAPQQMPMNGESVPNVMMEIPDEQIQQNVQTGQMEPQSNFVGVEQTVTYDLNQPPFEIEDPLMRRQFFRKVFFILLLQNILALPVIVLFALCFDEAISPKVYYSYWLLGFLIFIVMYIFSDYRRYPPVNYLTLILTTIFIVVEDGIYATYVRTSIALSSQLVVILQFIAMIIYSMQTRFKFTNLNAIFLSLFVFLVAYATVGVISPEFLLGMRVWSVTSCVYCVYDIQLMLSGHHGYNLKAEEYIFGAVNVYVDIPNFAWRFFRYIFLDHFVRIYEFLKKCCFAEVC